MIKRSISRTTFGKKLSQHGMVQNDIALSRMEIEQARLLVLKTADMMDRVGNKKARSEIAMIKVVVPRASQKIIDRAIQIHGAAGVSQDFFLAYAYVGARSIRLADGPDEVHIQTIAKLEVLKYEKVNQFQLEAYGLYKQFTEGFIYF
jgi:acyl-CoA dehydrogenase